MYEVIVSTKDEHSLDPQKTIRRCLIMRDRPSYKIKRLGEIVSIKPISNCIAISDLGGYIESKEYL